MMSFTCPTCGLTSHNEDDAWNRYCGSCKRFADDPTDTVLSDKPMVDSQFVADPLNVFGVWTFNETPWFPFTISLPPDCEIKLFADGKWEGSIEQLREKMATGKSIGCDGTPVQTEAGQIYMRALLWLILREMERDKKFW